jgi:predicted nucleic acid-binding protein
MIALSANFSAPVASGTAAFGWLRALPINVNHHQEEGFMQRYPTLPANGEILIPRIVRFALACLWLGGLSLGAQAQTDEDTGRKAAEELRVLVTEGTGVIGDLQPAINSGKTAKDKVIPDALIDQFKARYQKATGGAIDLKAAGIIGDTRRAYVQAFTNVVTRFQPNLIKGGQDAFVPAFFRAQTLGDFNKSMQGKLQAYATNRDGELINGDWAVAKVMKGSPLAGEVTKLMATGALDPVVKRSGNTVMGYYPMKLAAGCVACHAQNGLKQKEGAFGGALVAQIPVK